MADKIASACSPTLPRHLQQDAVDLG